MSRRHVILVGLPGSGKTTVGALVAARLRAPFFDVDRAIETRAGRTVARIFADDGEAEFRALERDAARELLAGEPAVLAPGGGWFADAEQRRAALAAGYAVYLETSPGVAARRLGGGAGRPLLKGFDPVLRMCRLLEDREGAYLEAPGRVATDARSPDEVADAVAQLARAEGGW